MSRPAVFLDRDGVLNAAVADNGRLRPPWLLDELRVQEAAAGTLQRLRTAGYLLFVVTNQPDVARGALGADALTRINDRLAELLPLDGIYSCVHDTRDGCKCRKPLPGMVHDAARDHDLELSSSWLIGDRWVDVAAGTAAGVRAILLETPQSWNATSSGAPPPDLRPVASLPTLEACVDYILAVNSPRLSS